jgi:hypothetical protein
MKNYVIKTNLTTDAIMPYIGTEYRQAVRKAVHKLKHRFNYRLKVYDLEAKQVYEYVIWYSDKKWVADKKMMFSMDKEVAERKHLLQTIKAVDSSANIASFDWMHYPIDFNAEEKKILAKYKDTDAKVVKNVIRKKEKN